MSLRLLASIALLAALLLAAGLLSLSLGPVNISPARVGAVLYQNALEGMTSIAPSRVGAVVLDQVGLHTAAFETTEELVITQIRMPRIVVGALAGMALGVAGAVMQGLFRNPMADPGIIGVSTGGAVGAVLAIALGLNSLFFLALPLFAFVGAMGATLLVYGIALVGGRFSMATLLLAGVAVSAFLGAVISTIVLAVPGRDQLREILFWLAGGLDSRSWEHVQIAAPMIVVGTLVAVVLARDLNLLMLGDDDARGMGVNLRLVRPVLIGAGALVTGASVAVSGTIAFVGLVVPHVLRLLVGPDHRVLVPASAVGGALFVVVADTVARTAIQPAEIRVGIITSLVGAPFFIFLLIRNKRRAEAL